MDIMLSESKNGIEIAKSLNDIQPVPIIFLTSVTDNLIMQEAILTAPASYLLKPFRREELQSAILLSLHKASLQSTQNYQLIEIGYGFRYHPYDRKLFYDDEPIYLGPKERRLVSCLIQAKGDVVAFKILEDTIWQGKYIALSSLRTLIYRLHKKLNCKLIETVSTFGCQIRLFDS